MEVPSKNVGSSGGRRQVLMKLGALAALVHAVAAVMLGVHMFDFPFALISSGSRSPIPSEFNPIPGLAIKAEGQAPDPIDKRPLVKRLHTPLDTTVEALDTTIAEEPKTDSAASNDRALSSSLSGGADDSARRFQTPDAEMANAVDFKSQDHSHKKTDRARNLHDVNAESGLHSRSMKHIRHEANRRHRHHPSSNDERHSLQSQRRRRRNHKEKHKRKHKHQPRSPAVDNAFPVHSATQSVSNSVPEEWLSQQTQQHQQHRQQRRHRHGHRAGSIRHKLKRRRSRRQMSPYNKLRHRAGEKLYRSRDSTQHVEYSGRSRAGSLHAAPASHKHNRHRHRHRHRLHRLPQQTQQHQQHQQHQQQRRHRRVHRAGSRRRKLRRRRSRRQMSSYNKLQHRAGEKLHRSRDSTQHVEHSGRSRAGSLHAAPASHQHNRNRHRYRHRLHRAIRRDPESDAADGDLYAQQHAAATRRHQSRRRRQFDDDDSRSI